MKRDLLGVLPLGLLLSLALSSPSAQAKLKIERFGQVAPGVFRGSRPSTPEDYAFLKAHGIKTILSLQTLPWDRSSEAHAATRYGIAFHSVPINGSMIPPEEKHVNAAEDFLHDPANQPVYVHCKLGRDRTGLVAALYQVYFMNVSSETAYHDELEAFGWKDVPWLHGLMIYYREHDDSRLRHAGRRGD